MSTEGGHGRGTFSLTDFGSTVETIRQAPLAKPGALMTVALRKEDG